MTTTTSAGNITAATTQERDVAPNMGLTRSLASFITNLQPESIPDSVERVLQKALVDAVGCGLFGLTTEWGKIIREFAAEQGGPKEATLWGGGGAKVSVMNAALVGGTAVHSFDFDDHSRAKIHPGAVVIPAVLALCERDHVSGRKLLTAIAAGYETMIRVSLAANPGAARMRGWHLTGTCGTFAAAAASSVILGFDTETTASALGLAGTQSSGLWAFNVDGAMSKRLHPGRAAQSGVMAALLAARGFQGPRFILEAEDGGFLKASSDQPRYSEITANLGVLWQTEFVCFKPYACCGSNHSSIDAALAVQREERLPVHDIDHIVVGVSKVVETQTGFVYRPSTVLNAQMSLRYDIAVALLDGQAYLEQFTEQRIRDFDVCELASKISIEVDPEMDKVYPELYAGKVTIVTKAGRVITKRVDYSEGMPENPMSREKIEKKFISLASTAVGEDDAEAVLQRLRTLYSTGDVVGLAKCLSKAVRNVS
jgi:2-methylcitrate dehydratase PrpD